jgi:hypothetical protein
VHRAGRKGHREAGSKPGDLFRRLRRAAANSLAVRKQTRQQTYRLEELELVTAVEERLL